MANNRMWLVHKPSGKQALLAKYYPSGGWAPMDDGDHAVPLGMLFYETDTWLPNPNGIGGGRIPLSSRGDEGAPEEFALYFDSDLIAGKWPHER